MATNQYGIVPNMDKDRLAALRSEYEAGNVSNAVLCRKYDITAGKLRDLAQREGWVKRTPPTEDEIMKSVSLFSFDPQEQAVLSAANVVAIHRQDVARLRSISNTLVERLGLELAGKLPVDADNRPIICRGSRESPADLLEKLSRVLVRTTEIERQAYGLKTFDPDAAATDAQVQAQLDALEAELEEITKQKADAAPNR